MYALSVLLCLAILAGTASGGDSPLECANTETHYEGEQCAINLLRTADDELQRYLKETKRVWNDTLGVVKALEAAQTQWIEFREATCGPVRETWTTGTGAGVATLAHPGRTRVTNRYCERTACEKVFFGS